MRHEADFVAIAGVSGEKSNEMTRKMTFKNEIKTDLNRLILTCPVRLTNP